MAAKKKATPAKKGTPTKASPMKGKPAKMPMKKGC
jgi:hypothetical protein